MSATSCPSQPPTDHASGSSTSTSTVDLQIEGMACASCAQRVETILSQQEGVRHAAVNFATSSARVEFTRGAVNVADLAQAVRDVGFGVVEETAELSIDGMSCASCVRRVEDALRSLPGVIQAEVNFATHTATVRYLSGSLEPENLVQAVRESGD